MSEHATVWFSIRGMPWEEKLAALAVQGLANRAGPRVMLDTGFWNWPEADSRWRALYEAEHGFRFEEVGRLGDLVVRCEDAVRGIAVWDPDRPRTAWAAATLAGIDAVLPAPPAIAERFPDLPVVHDLRGRFEHDLDAMEWVCDELLPRCAPRIACSIEKLWSGWAIESIDYAVQRRAPVYQLKPDEKDARESALTHRLLERVGPNAAIFGWAEPEERYSMLVSMHNNYILCSEAPNLSFHAKVPCDRVEWRQAGRRDPASFELDRVHYVGLMTSEGDALKIHSVFHGGAWLDPARGSVPINWGFQPRLVEIAPAMADYYYRTAGERDFFVCGPSGAGYTYPNVMGEPGEFFQSTGEWLRKTDLDVVECWLHFSRPVYEAYARAAGVGAFTLPCGPLGTTFVGDDTPVFLRGSRLNYFDPKQGAAGLARAIRAQASEFGDGPSFSTVFFVPDTGSPTAQGGFSPTQLRETIDALDGEPIRVTTLDEMTWAAREARKLGWIEP